MRGFVRDEGGATAIEYTLIASLFALGTLMAYMVLSDQIASMFAEIATAATEEAE